MISAKVTTDVSGMLSLVKKAKARSITLKGVRAGAKVLLKAVRPRTPRRKRSGALRQAQGVKAAKGRKGKTISFAVQGARVKVQKFVKLDGYRTPQKVVPANYDHLVQGGTRQHRLGKGEKLERIAVGRRRSVKGTGQIAGGLHPGAKKNPYRRSTYEAVKDQVGRVMNATMGTELQKEIAKENAKIMAKVRK